MSNADSLTLDEAKHAVLATLAKQAQQTEAAVVKLVVGQITAQPCSKADIAGMFAGVVAAQEFLNCLVECLGTRESPTDNLRYAALEVGPIMGRRLFATFPIDTMKAGLAADADITDETMKIVEEFRESQRGS